MAQRDDNFNPMKMSELTRDAFRSLRMNISFSGGDEDIKTLVVTSAVPNEGKTSVSLGLGISMAQSMKNTLIIECDCRRPSVGNRLKLRPRMNWIDVLYQKAELSEAVVQTDCDNLYFLDAEPGLVHSVELLNSGRFRDMVDKLKKNFDFIIFDTPPLGSFIDAAVLSEYADGVILVVSSGSREIKLIQATIEQLKKANAKSLGVVLNRVNAHRNRYYQYGDYYYRNREKDKRVRDKTEKKQIATADTERSKKAQSRTEEKPEKPPKAARTKKSASREAAGENVRRKSAGNSIPPAEVNEDDDINWDEYIKSIKTDPDDAGTISSAVYTPSDAAR